MIANAREASDRLAKLLSSERAATVEFVLQLAEFNRLRQWEALGYPSLFMYLRRVLHLPEGEAYCRMHAARLVLQFPQLVDVLRDGRIALSALPDVAKAITAENCDEVLPRFFHRSVRESKVLAAAIHPAEVPALARRHRQGRAGFTSNVRSK